MNTGARLAAILIPAALLGIFMAFVVSGSEGRRELDANAEAAEALPKNAMGIVRVGDYNTIFYLDEDCFIYTNRPNEYPELRGCN